MYLVQDTTQTTWKTVYSFGETPVVLSSLVFSWLTLRLHQSDLDLLFQACLFFSPVRMSSVRGLGLSLDIFQPCHRILFRAMKKGDTTENLRNQIVN